LRCSVKAVSATKEILQLFESATGLAINYHKTTFLPIVVPSDEAYALATAFGTTVSSFPQTYLGLPLTPHKVTVSDCLPLIASCDKYLFGWQASLLNSVGRLTLCTSVLSALPLHYMSALDVPKTVIKAIDRRRRAFFWTGEDQCHGSKCLVAWDAVQAPKDKGGLGVKDLALQNRCLLMKFINKLFSSDCASWKAWVMNNVSSFDTPVSSSCSFLWRIVSDELDTFRSITYVRVNNRAATSFWFDHWLPDGPLSSTHTALFSHTTTANISVMCVFQSGFDLRLRPRLTTAASNQLASLLDILQGTRLGDSADIRLLKHTQRPFTTREAYEALDSSGDATDVHGRRIWGTRLPNKVKVFAWLYFKNRLSTRVNLHAKNVVDSSTCERCSGANEDRFHVFFGCVQSSRLWNRLNL
jgi:mannosylglycoprotein endo-beta-mannosidase